MSLTSAVGREPEPLTANGVSSDDPVLAALERAAGEYAAVAAEHARARDELARVQEELARADEVRQHLGEELSDALEERDRLRRQVAHQRERADRLAAALKSVHTSLQSGNLYDLILRACLHITGATRGLYVTAWGDWFRVRAAVAVDGYPATPPSPFLKALCQKVLADGETFICSGADCLRGLPAPADGERFRTLLAAPVVLLKDLNGLVILGDKAGGEFDRDDAEVVVSIGDQAAVAAENQRLQNDLFDAYFHVVGVLADAVEAKDSYIHGHCELVARLSRLVAERLGLSEEECSVAFYGGLLHDVGKIGVSDGILNKPGRLTPEEWDLMRSHVRMGRDLLDRVPMLARVAEVVMHHHERYDGTGYPDGLAGDAIPLTARIVGAVDAYCAMTSKRSYKESQSDAEARAELARCKGSHFDPRVVDALLAVLDHTETADDDPPLGRSHPADFRHLIPARLGNGRGGE